MEDRFPSPNLIVTHQGTGKERYIKSKVNPSSMNTSNSDTGNYITDDASLKVFMDHLVKLVVSQWLYYSGLVMFTILESKGQRG